MLTRILTGVLLAPLVVLLFVAGPTWAQSVVLIAASALCVMELLAMTMPDRPVERWLGLGLCVALQVSMWNHPTDLAGDWLPALFVPALIVVARPDPIEKAAFRLFALWAAIIYVVMPFHYGVMMVESSAKPWMLFVLGVVWAGDTGAYFAGRFLGRHKLHPKVSPKKTIEGAIGGLLSSVGGGFLMVEVLGLTGLEGWKIAVFSALGGALGQLGDLAESLVKRACGVKDSGTILPGHGGMLDRLDGVIFAMPFFYFALTGWR
jgi:phosphatidate cytidylyltransferase